MTVLPRPSYTTFIGIDIAATSVTLSWTTHDHPVSTPMIFAQTTDGWRQLLQYLRGLPGVPAQTLVVMEATGSYWVTLATMLHAASFVVSVINPAQAHHFAKALLKRAKTDAIDAQTLAQLARTLQPAAWTPPPAVYHELQQRLTQRESLVTMRQQARNQHHALIQGPIVITAVQERLEELIDLLDAQIRDLDAELDTALKADPTWGATAEHLRTIPGIGRLSTAWLLAATLNFTACASADAAVAYAGLAPMPWQSGTSVNRGARLRHTGHGRLRRVLYLATLSACRSNPIIKAFYDRLRAAGKPMKVARCAAARKLLHLAWAVATKQQPFNPSHRMEPCPGLNPASPD